MDGWDNFFVAMAGAAVAFAGLALVSISINLERIVNQPGLIGRSAGPLIILFSLFVASSIILIPDQRVRFYGYELLAVGIAYSVVIGRVLRAQWPLAKQLETQGLAPKNSFRFRGTLCFATALFLLAAGAAMALGHARGAYLVVPAMIVGFLVSFMEAWVLLIEIDR